MNYDIIFAIMAVQEVEFFCKIACRMRDDYGLKIGFLLFHEAGDVLLEKMGIDYFSFHKLAMQEKQEATPEEINSLVKKYNVKSLEEIYRHEMLTTNRLDTKLMTNKVARYFKAMEKFLQTHKARCIIQELGGFIAPQVLFYAATNQKIDHIFIEPAVYNKKIAFSLNSLYADIPDHKSINNFTPAEINFVDNYLKEALNKKPIVIPHKDRLFFQDMSLKRLMQPVNFKKLGRKLYHKYIVRKHEEYNAIGWYVTAHVIKLLHRKGLNNYYSKLEDFSDKYVYFPLHVPLDVQLTVRCCEYLDQLALLEKAVKLLPQGYNLYVKEHPASIGAYPLAQMKSLLEKNKNIKLIHPGTNSFDIVKNAQAVITINSKVGIESLIQCKPVIIVGKCFYKNKGVTFDSENISDLKTVINKALGANVEFEKVKELFLKIYRWSYSGELYEFSPQNIDNFYNSTVSYLKSIGFSFSK